MNILFIFKNDNFLAPIGLCCISAAAKKAGHNTYLCDLNTEDPMKIIDRINPGIIAYSSTTGEAKHYLNINTKIKTLYPDIFTIMGGPHPTFFRDVVNSGDLDAICIGEGDEAFAELADRIGSGGAVQGIKNIVLAGDNGRDCMIRDLVHDLDSLPFPDYELLYENTPMGGYPLKNFITSRGCPFKCTYCFNNKWREIYAGKGPLVRKHSVDYIIEDILKVKEKWPISTVKFYDDIFVLKKDKWLEEFSAKYKEKIGLPFFVLMRADTMDEDMVKLLKYAGCRTISMSIESGNPDIRRTLLKRDMSDEQIIRAHRLCEKYSINTFTNCIIGLPGSTLNDELMSVSLTRKCRVTWAEYLIFHPYPSTELGDKLIENGDYTPDYTQMHTSYMNKSPLSTFTDREKNVQKNLAVLGAVASITPAFSGFITKYLIHIKHNSLFTMIYYCVKMYIIRKKIYVTKTSFYNSLQIFIRSLKQEMFRHESVDKVG